VFSWSRNFRYFLPKRFARLDRLFKLLEHFVGRILQAGCEHGNPHLQPSDLPSRFFRVTVLLFEPVQLLLDPIQLLVDFLSDRPKVEGRSTARSSARLCYSQESEVVSAIPKKVKL